MFDNYYNTQYCLVFDETQRDIEAQKADFTPYLKFAIF